MHSAIQLVHVVQKKTGFTNLRRYLIKNLGSESQQYVQNLTTSTFYTKNVKVRYVHLVHVEIKRKYG